MSPTMVFVSSTMLVMPASIVFAAAIALFHSLNSCEPQSPCDDRQGVIKHPGKHYYKYSILSTSLRAPQKLSPPNEQTRSHAVIFIIDKKLALKWGGYRYQIRINSVRIVNIFIEMLDLLLDHCVYLFHSA